MESTSRQKKVIITGGSGLIGQRLVRHLRGRGYQVVVLSRNPQRVRGLPSGVQVLPWDARSASGWGGEVEGVTAIVNLAGENLAGAHFFPARWTAKRKKALLESRLNAGKAVVEAVEAASRKPQVVIQASAVGFYGPCGDEIITEESPAGDDFLARLCQRWEASTASVEALGVRHVVIRTGIYLSPEGGALYRLVLPIRLFVGGPFGSGEQWYAWIHHEDETNAIRFLIENEEARGVFNLTAPRPVRNREFGSTLARVLRRPFWLPVPGFAMRLLFGEVATVVLDGQRVHPQRLLDLGFTFRYPEIEMALESLRSH